jgi:formate hydrogenlyase transcriptional activator
VDVRVIAATNRDLEQLVTEGRFRSDLFFRVNVLPIRVPPLRERRQDVPLLVHFFVARFGREMAKTIERVAPETMERLIAYDWPGNVRELQNIIERAMVLAKGPVLELGPDFLPSAPRGKPSAAGSVAAVEHRIPSSRPAGVAGSPTSLEEVSRQHMLQILEDCRWVIEGPRGAARVLCLNPSTLRSRIKKMGLQPRR